jgi:hypothetical protein
MKRWSTALLGICICVAIVCAVVGVQRLRLLSSMGGEVQTGSASEILIMRTPGGLLEVATVTATEQFDQTFAYSMLGMNVGKTVAHIRVRATYRYHIELAPEWKVYRQGDVFRVSTPPLKPSLPVAVDLGEMEKDVGGTWYLVAINDQVDLDVLEGQITKELARKATSPFYMNLGRDAAQRTVNEFVKKWLVTQHAWKAADHPRIDVVIGRE